MVLLAERIEAYKKQYAGKLEGKIVLLSGKRPFELPSQPETQRWSEDDLDEIQNDYSSPQEKRVNRLIGFLNEEQVSAVMMTNTEGNGGVIFATSFGSHLASAPVPPPAMQLMP